MQPGKRHAEVGVAFVGADDNTARFGDGEVHARDARLRGDELVAQVPPRRLGQIVRVGRPLFRPQAFVKQLADFFLLDVDGRQHDVARRLVAKLHDPFAQIRVNDFDAVLLEIRIQVAFLGEHRLALDHPLHAVLLQDLEHDAVMLFGIARPMHDGSQPRGSRLELLEVIGQPAEYIELDLRRGLAQLFPFRHGTRRFVPLGAHEPQGLIVPVRALLVGNEAGRFVGMAERMRGHGRLNG